MLAFFVEHQREVPFTQPAQSRLAVIVVDSEEDAAEVESILFAGEPFDEVARTWSQDEATSVRGGDIGRGLTPQQMVAAFPPEILPTIDSLEIGAWTGPHMVEGISASPVLFIKVLDRKERREHTFEEMRETVRDVLEAMRVPKLYETWARERLRLHAVSFFYDLFDPVAEDLLAPDFTSDLLEPGATLDTAPEAAEGETLGPGTEETLEPAERDADG